MSYEILTLSTDNVMGYTYLVNLHRSDMTKGTQNINNTKLWPIPILLALVSKYFTYTQFYTSNFFFAASVEETSPWHLSFSAVRVFSWVSLSAICDSSSGLVCSRDELAEAISEFKLSIFLFDDCSDVSLFAS